MFITANVSFITHDTIRNMRNRKYKTNRFQRAFGCIEVGDNVMIGSGTRILYNVRIGSNVIIGAGSIITKDIPDNSVAAGVPCRVIGKFEDLVERRKSVVAHDKAEEYLDECIGCYREKYGVCATIDNYVVYFIPTLAVCKIMK